MEATKPDTQASGGDDFSQKNEKHFDKVAPGEWPEWVYVLHQQILDFLVSTEFQTWAGLGSASTGRRMLDYACGNGLISKALKPLFSSVVGVDVSAGMLDKYRVTVANLGLGPHEMIGVHGDLLSAKPQPTEPPLPEEDLWNFDLAAISMALHHVENPETAVERLAARLKVGGKLLIVDWTPPDGSTPAQKAYQEEVRQKNDAERIERALKSHAASHTVSRPNGFTYEEQKELFEKAGCYDVKWKLAEELTYIPVVDAKAQLYWAIATKR